MAARFTCTATRVHDGDGPIWCEKRDAAGKTIKIRLHAVAAREMGETQRALVEGIRSGFDILVIRIGPC